MSERLLKTIFDWDNFALYLSGPIDFAQDGGKGWRSEWTEKLVSIGIKRHQIYNPCQKPFQSAQFNFNDESAIFRECRKSGDWQRFHEVMGQVVHIDLRLVDKSDVVIVNMPLVDTSVWRNKVADLIETHSPSRESTTLFIQMLAEMKKFRVPTYGTIHEIVIAHLQRKPIFMVWEETGLQDCSAWLMRLVGYQNIFSHVDHLIEHLRKISTGQQPFDANEWLLIKPKTV